MSDFIISQIAATLSIIFGLAIPYLLDSRKFILICKIISGLCWIVHHYLLGTPSASFNAFISLIVTILSYFRLYLPSYKSKGYPIFFIAFSGIVTTFTYTSIASIFAYLGSSLNLLGRWQFKTKTMRLLFLLAAIPWVLYCLVDKTPIGLLANIISIIMLTIAIYRFDIKE